MGDGLAWHRGGVFGYKACEGMCYHLPPAYVYGRLPTAHIYMLSSVLLTYPSVLLPRHCTVLGLPSIVARKRGAPSV